MKSIARISFRTLFAVFVFTLIYSLSGGLSNTQANAQELGLALNKKDEAVKVAGITQFIDGRAMKTETSGFQTEIAYQTALYEGDRAETTAGSVAKFVSRSGCVFILRGEGAIAAPVEKKPWRMRAEILRLLCPSRTKTETFGIANAPLALKEGEVLFLSDRSEIAKPMKRVMLLKGAASLSGQALELHKLYDVTPTGPSPLTPQPTENELRKLNLESRPPREGYEWPEPEKPSTVRMIFGPALGADHIGYDNDDLSQGGLSGAGPRLQLHFRTAKDHSLIISATYRETKDKSRESSPNSPPADGVTNTVKSELLEVGLRNRHDRWWSPFWRVGAGVSTAKISYTKTVSGQDTSYMRYSYDFYVLSATYGIDAYLTPQFLRPFGFYASAEAQIIQSVGRGGRVNESTSFTSGQAPPPEPWRLTDINAAASVGIQYDF